MNYTFEQYVALYEALDGKTTHFYPGSGVEEWSKELFSRQEFEEQLARLEEIQGHDTEWLFANHPKDYIDVWENELWERFDLESDLFVIELEKYEKIQKAMKEATE